MRTPSHHWLQFSARKSASPSHVAGRVPPSVPTDVIDVSTAVGHDRWAQTRPAAMLGVAGTGDPPYVNAMVQSDWVKGLAAWLLVNVADTPLAPAAVTAP